MNFRRGSLTVELACLMPVILFVIFSLLGLCFYVHNRCFLSAGACEAALTGAMESHRQDGVPLEAARLRAKERASVGFFGMDEVNMQVQETGKEWKVTYTGDVFTLFGGLRWNLKIQGEAKKISPVQRIRKARIWKGG